jgi:glycosyltransferase involved in cell wall biosynthesis
VTAPALPRSRISVCVVCRNEADKLDACLASASWADELLVMDLDSGDGSADVARRHGAEVIARAPIPIVEPLRNELAARASGDWILALDPDERVTPGLARELRRLSAHEDLDVVEIPFTHWDFGHPPTHRLHRYDPKPRFYRRDRISWPDEPNRLPNFERSRLHIVPDRDDLVIVHERNRTVPEALERAIRYAPAEAQAMIDRGETFTARRMLSTLAAKTRKQFVYGDPWRDGMPGLLRASVLVAFHFYVWACFWQLSGGRRTPEDDAILRRVGVVVATGRATYRAARVPVALTRRLVGRLRLFA